MTSLERPVDEMANLVTHAIGFLLSIMASVYLMLQVVSNSAAVVVACGVYSTSLMLVYACSTLSHLFHDHGMRQRFRTLDQACIFLLIAGTYSPIAVVYLDHGWWRTVQIVMWLSAIVGIVRVVQVRDLPHVDKVFFGLLGFLPVVTVPELCRRAPWELVAWLVAGGACYYLGTLFLWLSTRVKYTHAVWHVLVIAGSACHYRAILVAISSG